MTNIGPLIDKMADVDSQIDRAEAALRDLKATRERLQRKVLKVFKLESIDGAKGRKGVAAIRRTKHASIKDLRKFIGYVKKRNAYDLFQNRIAPKAYFDRLEDGEVVPGVEVYERVRVSITRRK